jgi:CTP-dependent riboflavin kinase
MKRLFFAILLLGLLAAGNNYVYASMEKTVQIDLNKAYSGKLTYDQTEAYYKITLPSDGNVTLSIKQQAGASWYGSILNSKGETYNDVITSSSDSTMGNATTEVGLAKGTYYVIIEDYYGTLQKNFQFTVNFTAGSTFEKEFNDTVATATAMKLNQTYKGNLSYDDVDYYKITLPEDGNVTLSMSQLAGNSWYTRIQNEKGDVYTYLVTDSSNSVKGNATTEIGLPKGTYYLVVDSDYGAVNKPYEIKAAFEASNYYEKEFNNTVATANTMKLNKTYKGEIGYDDQDYYKITLPSDGVVTLSMNQTPSAQWYAHIQNSKGDIFEDLYTDSSSLVKGKATTVVGLPKGTYYIYVDNNFGAQHKQYEIKAAFKATNYYEKEFNNTLAKANPITLNKSYKGRIRDYSDQDVFKINVTKDSTLVLSINQLAETQWAGHIQNSNGKIFKEFYTEESGLVSGQKNVEVTLKKGTYYLVLYSGSNASQKTYEFKVSLKTKSLNASQIKVTNNKGKADTVKVSGIAKGDTIKVYSASSKGKLLASKKATGTSTTLSIKQLGQKSGKVYVSVTSPNLKESNRRAVSYAAEKSSKK